jgi:NAD-dependent deacetylase
MVLSAEVVSALEGVRAGDGLVVFLTGAGISAESGIPTFRGAEGYWTVGSAEYRPADLATAEAFGRDPRLVWSWYLYRLGVCRAAEPNPAHRALARLEQRLGERFLLVSQNVDGLHRRAGNRPERTLLIHGDLESMRCAGDCSAEVWPLPAAVGPVARGGVVDDAGLAALRCLRCGGPARPHVLWFDEYYDELRYRWQSSLRAAERAGLLCVVGSSGATNLPVRMVEAATAAGAVVIDINPAGDGFAAGGAAGPDRWLRVEERAGVAVPAIVEVLIG